MTPPDGKSDPDGKPDKPAAPAGETPAWAESLRKLYDGVVEEPLPASFEELLKGLDQVGKV